MTRFEAIFYSLLYAYVAFGLGRFLRQFIEMVYHE